MIWPDPASDPVGLAAFQNLPAAPSQINSAGQVTGNSLKSTVNGDVPVAVLWQNSQSQPMAIASNETCSTADDINNQGQVVGIYYDRSAFRSGVYLWRNGVMTDLTAIVNQTGATPYFGDPRINDRGDVVASSWLYANGRGAARPRISSPARTFNSRRLMTSTIRVKSSGLAPSAKLFCSLRENAADPRARDLPLLHWLLFSSSALPGYSRENRTAHSFRFVCDSENVSGPNWEANHTKPSLMYRVIIRFLGSHPVPPPKGWAERLVSAGKRPRYPGGEDAHRCGYVDAVGTR